MSTKEILPLKPTQDEIESKKSLQDFKVTLENADKELVIQSIEGGLQNLEHSIGMLLGDTVVRQGYDLSSSDKLTPEQEASWRNNISKIFVDLKMELEVLKSK